MCAWGVSVLSVIVCVFSCRCALEEFLFSLWSCVSSPVDVCFSSFCSLCDRVCLLLKMCASGVSIFSVIVCVFSWRCVLQEFLFSLWSCVFSCRCVLQEFLFSLWSCVSSDEDVCFRSFCSLCDRVCLLLKMCAWGVSILSVIVCVFSCRCVL